jgi:uncharacterized repeat protein (TIGR01451 family)
MKKLLSGSCALFIAGQVAALSVQCWSVPATCGYPNGGAGASPSGGTPPYTYLWSNAATSQTISGLVPGTYSVTVTDNLGAQASGSVEVTASPTLLFGASSINPTCPGSCTGDLMFYTSGFGGVPPYSYSTPPSSQNADQVFFTGVCWYPDGGLLTVTDANGCSGTVQFGVPNAYYAQTELLQVMPGCQGVNGQVTFMLDYTLTVTLRVLDADLNVIYQDLDPPSQVPIIVDGLPPGEYTIRCITEEIPGGWCYGETPFTIADLGTDCGQVTGRLYVETGGNCFFEEDEDTGMPYRVLVVEPGPVYGMTNAAGLYTINLVEGAYTIQNNDDDLIPLCPPTQPAPFVISAQSPIALVDLADSSSTAPDLELTCVHAEARPGFVHHVWLTIRNMSPYFAGSPNLTFSFDPLLTFVSSSYPLYNLSPGQIQWPGQYFLPGFDTRTIHLQFQVPADPGLLGTVITSTGFVQQSPPEADVSNNTCTGSVTIIGSYDPNDKTAFTSTGASDALYFINEDEWIDYVIRFQNTGTASAINVSITDTLPPTLDPGTLNVLGWSHPLTALEMGPGQVLTWRFDNINLPDSGSNEAASHGFVSFRIRPKPPLVPGTVIENIANIYFEFNPPVITEPSVLVAEFSTGMQNAEHTMLQVYPNPAQERITVVLPEPMRVALRDATGQVVLAAKLARGAQGLDLQRFAPGAYALTATSGSGASFTRRITKQ